MDEVRPMSATPQNAHFDTNLTQRAWRFRKLLSQDRAKAQKKATISAVIEVGEKDWAPPTVGDPSEWPFLRKSDSSDVAIRKQMS